MTVRREKVLDLTRKKGIKKATLLVSKVASVQGESPKRSSFKERQLREIHLQTVKAVHITGHSTTSSRAHWTLATEDTLVSRLASSTVYQNAFWLSGEKSLRNGEKLDGQGLCVKPIISMASVRGCPMNEHYTEHKVQLVWARESPDFIYETFPRGHEIRFEGGQLLRGSSAAAFLGNPEDADPEAMLAASAASCHMLTFLAIAAKSRMVVDSYKDNAVAILAKNAKGVMAVTKIILRPQIAFSGDNIPSVEKLAQLHEKSHRNCFIANSLLCEVVVEGH